MLKITTVIENTVASPSSGLNCEPGLSFYLEYQGKKVLFDTGASEKMVENARTLQIPLEEIDLCVISHGHFDHTGGLERVLDLNQKVRVILKEGADGAYFFKLGFLKKDIGVPSSLFERYRDRIQFIRNDLEPLPGFALITKIKRTRPLVKGNAKLLKKIEGKYVRDDFAHELVASLKTPKGMVVITGCSHNGVLNMVDAVKEKYPDEPIAAVIGGFHLMGIPLLKNSMSISPAEVERLAQEMVDYRIGKTYTMHCTGAKAYGIMKKVMGDRLEYLASGDQIAF